MAMTLEPARSGPPPVAPRIAEPGAAACAHQAPPRDCVYSIKHLAVSSLPDAHLRRLLDAARALADEHELDGVLRLVLGTAADLAT